MFSMKLMFVEPQPMRASLSMIVTTQLLTVQTEPVDGLLSTQVKAWLPSRTVSLTNVTVAFTFDTPGAKVITPLVAT